MTLPIRTGFLGFLDSDPTVSILVAGNWWYNKPEKTWKFFNGEVISLFGGTYEKTVAVPAEEFGKPYTNPPTVVNEVNLTLYRFTLNTDKMTYKFPVPSDYAEGDMKFYIIWTNDGGTDDKGKNVKWQLDYQVAHEGDVISGSHANSPKSVEDTYESDSGWVEHHSGIMTIGAADFAGKLCIYIKISAVTPTGTPLTCEPHLIGLCFTYTAQRFVI